MSETHIKADRHGVGSIVVNGVDVSMYVAPEFTVTNRAGRSPVVSLHLIGMNVEVEADADVQIPEDVAKALEALGWKRP